MAAAGCSGYSQKTGFVAKFIEVDRDGTLYDVVACVSSGQTRDIQVELASATPDSVTLRCTYQERASWGDQHADAKCSTIRVRLPEVIGNRTVLDVGGAEVPRGRL